MKIVVMDGHALDPGDLGWQGFEALGEFEYYDRTPPQLILPRMAGAGAVLVNKTPITAATLAACPDLRYIGVLATGYNVVDTAAAAARGIPVCNVPDYGTEAVAQFTFALLLELCRNKLEHDGFRVLTHSLVPPNDGGIALGQAVYGARKLEKEDSRCV